MSIPFAKVVADVPLERVDTSLGDGSLPQIGDLAEVDHMYTSDSGEWMHIVVCKALDGRVRWVADLLGSEIVPVPRDGSSA